MADQEACMNCRFWNPNWKFKREQRYQQEGVALDQTNPRRTEGLRAKSSKGLCRRYAPQASALTTVWMETKPDDWCGDYEKIQEQ